MTYIKSFLITLFLVFFVACSDSKPDKLISSFSNDLNGSTTLATGRVSQIRVYANYDDGSKEEFTDSLVWSSSDETVATVSSGLVQTYSVVGNVDITYKTATKNDDGSALYENTVSLSVKNITLIDISFSKSTLSLVVGESSSIYAEGTFEDNITLEITTQDITSDATWSSSDDNISSVSLVDSTAIVKGIAEGNTTITANDSGVSSSLAVEVTKTTYTSVKIYSDKTTFNVDQTIELEARGTTDNGTVVMLENSDVTWVSNDTSVVTLSQNIATAVINGDATVSVNINNTSISNQIELSVDKEHYVRLFKDEVELEFPYVAIESNSSLSETLGTFTLLAVGEDFQVGPVLVKDFNGYLKSATEAAFDGLITLDLLIKDVNKTFDLKQDGVQTQLNFTFDINDTTRSTFSQKYEETN